MLPVVSVEVVPALQQYAHLITDLLIHAKLTRASWEKV